MYTVSDLYYLASGFSKIKMKMRSSYYVFFIIVILVKNSIYKHFY